MKAFVIYILIAFPQGETIEDGHALWAIDNLQDCETVAEIFSLNSEGEVFTCIKSQEVKQ